MAKFDSKSFNAAAFGKYVDRIPNVTKTELAKSGAVGSNENARSALSNQTGSLYARIPFFGRIDGSTSQNNTGAADITAYTKTQTDEHMATAVNAHNTAVDAHSDIRVENAKLRAELELLKLKYDTSISKNPFTVTFGSLDGLTVTGVWNADLARIEF